MPTEGSSPPAVGSFPPEFLARFRIHSVLGSGATGSVLLATQVGLDRLVAVKCLHRLDGTLLARFRREAELTAALSHPNLLGVRSTIVDELKAATFTAQNNQLEARAADSKLADERRMAQAAEAIAKIDELCRAAAKRGHFMTNHGSGAEGGVERARREGFEPEVLARFRAELDGLVQLVTPAMDHFCHVVRALQAPRSRRPSSLHVWVLHDWSAARTGSSPRLPGDREGRAGEGVKRHSTP